MTLAELVRALSPNRPLEADDARYVERPENGGERLARIAAVDPDPIAVFGPPGVGKSTELARAARVLTDEMLPVLVRLDRRLNLAMASVDRVYGVCDSTLNDAVYHFSKGLPPLAHVPVSENALFGHSRASVQRDGFLNNIRNAASHIGRTPIFLLDGLEKADEPIARQIMNAIATLAGEAGWIVIAPPALVVGPESFRVMEDYRHFSMGPLPPDLGATFLRNLLMQRADPGDLIPDAVIDAATTWSGGIPRTFLSLLKSAGLHAILADRSVVDSVDVETAVAEHKEAMIRILAGGDVEHLARLAAGKGIDGMPTDARARLLSHGVLLERSGSDGVVHDIHPFVHPEVDGTVISISWPHWGASNR